MNTIAEKGGGTFQGIKLLLCENPLPPIDEAIAAAQAEVPHGNYYTEPYSAPLRQLISEQIGVPERLIHINAGSELILRQIFDRFGQQVHLLTPTYMLFPEIARRYTETRLLPENDFAFDLAELAIPQGTTLAVIVNPNNPNGGIFDMTPLPELLRRHPETRFLVDEAFIGLAGQSVAQSGARASQPAGDAHPVQGPQPGGLPGRLRDIARGHRRRPERPQRRLPARPPQSGGGHRHASARRQDSCPRRAVARLDRETRGAVAHPGRAHLSDRNLFLSRRLRTA